MAPICQFPDLSVLDFLFLSSLHVTFANAQIIVKKYVRNIIFFNSASRIEDMISRSFTGSE